jgi:transcriptional regulator with XRE-family HTH domain
VSDQTETQNDDEEDSTSYARAVGVCLRRARQQLGLSLQAVEAMSSQEFKASVLGAYERGERSISVPRLQRLAMLYNVPVDLLLPEPERRAAPEGAAAPGGQRQQSDVDAQINAINGPERELLRRFVRMIQAQRRDGAGGPGSSIRSEDIRAIELILGSSSRGGGRREPEAR